MLALVSTGISIMSGVPGVRLDVTLSSILTDLGSIFTAVFGWVPTVFETILGNPLLFLMIAIGIPFIAIGVVKRLLRTR